MKNNNFSSFVPLAYMRFFKIKFEKFIIVINNVLKSISEDEYLSANIKISCFFKYRKIYGKCICSFEKNDFYFNDKIFTVNFDVEKIKGMQLYKKLYWKLKFINARNLLTFYIIREIFNHQIEFINLQDNHKLKILTLSALSEKIRKDCSINFITPSIICALTDNIRIRFYKTATIRLEYFFVSKNNLLKCLTRKIISDEYLRLSLNKNEINTLSDSDIKKILFKEHNLTSTRRNVAQIRKKLQIPNSLARRKIILQDKPVFNFTGYFKLSLAELHLFAPARPGVYEIYYKNLNAFYVGFTSNIFRRLKAHLYNKNGMLKNNHITNNIIFKYLETTDYKKFEHLIFKKLAKLDFHLLNIKEP